MCQDNACKINLRMLRFPPVRLMLDFMPPGCSKRVKSGGGRCYPSHKKENICLPARVFKTINKIREHTKATVPLLPPSASSFSPTSSIHSHFVRGSFASTMQTSQCLHVLLRRGCRRQTEANAQNERKNGHVRAKGGLPSDSLLTRAPPPSLQPQPAVVLAVRYANRDK